VQAARANLVQGEAELEDARSSLKRAQDLARQNFISGSALDTAEARYNKARAQIDTLKAQIGVAEASYRVANGAFEQTLIRAPFAGIVLTKSANVGDIVTPFSSASGTTGAVVTMADLTTLEVEVDVNEAYIGRVRSGQEARIILDAYPDTEFRGRVRQVVPTADRQRATVQVKVSITDRDPRILPEMGARVDFLAPEPPRGAGAAPVAPVMRVPAAAVREHDGQTVVWLVRDGRLEPRPVAAGPVSGGYREIRSGLAGGELVLVGGVETPRPGLRVRTATP